jgi:hypothetical protein
MNRAAECRVPRAPGLRLGVLPLSRRVPRPRFWRAGLFPGQSHPTIPIQMNDLDMP